MALFTETQIETILLKLGYPVSRSTLEVTYKSTLALHLQGEYPQVIVDEVDSILTQLVEIETLLQSLRPDYLAQQVGNLRVSFAQQRSLLLADKSRLLKDLSKAVGLPLASKLPSASIVSYW